MNRKKLLQRLAQGAFRNVAFRDMVALVERYNITLEDER
jgi:hypothetical protein